MKWVYHITARDMQTEIYSIVFPFCPSTQFRRKIEMDIQIFCMWVPYRWSDYNWNSSIFTCEIPSWNPCRKKCRKDWLSFCTFPSKHIHIQHFWRVQPNKSCSSRSIKNSKSINTAESKKKIQKKSPFLAKIHENLLGSPHSPTSAATASACSAPCRCAVLPRALWVPPLRRHAATWGSANG